MPSGGFAPGSSGATGIVDPGGGTKVCDLYSDGGIGAFGLPVSGDTPRSMGSSCGTRGSGMASVAEDGIGFSGVAIGRGVVVAVGTGVGAGTGTAAGAGVGEAAAAGAEDGGVVTTGGVACVCVVGA